MFNAGLHSFAQAKRGYQSFPEAGLGNSRHKGSHIILVKEGHIATLSVPNHPEVARGTLRGLISRAGVSLEEFLKALD